MPNICVAGIDPGASGAIAFLFSNNPGTVSAEDMPLAADRVCGAQLADILRVMQPDYVFIEYAAARPKQGVSSAFQFGFSYGVPTGVVLALGIPIQPVTPKMWKGHFRLSSDKEKSRALALQTWPSRADLFKRKRDENRAEAALIALYGVRRLGLHVPEIAA